MSFRSKGSMAATVTVSVEPDRSGNFICDAAIEAHDVTIQRAIDYVSGLGGGSVHLERGAYSGGKITGVSDLLLEGEGFDTVYTLVNGTDDHVIEFAGTVGVHIENVTIRDLKIDGNRANQALGVGGEGTGIQLSFVDRFLIDNVYITETKAHGIALYDATYGSVVNNKIDTCELSHGIDVDAEGGGVGSSHISIANNQIKDSGYSGIKAEHAGFISIMGNTIEQKTVLTGAAVGYGIDLEQDTLGDAIFLHDISVMGNIIDGADYGIIVSLLDADNESICIIGNTINGTTRSSLRILNVSVPFLIANNTIRDSTTLSMQIQGSKYINIDGNTILNSGSTAIQLYDDGLGTESEFINVVNNQFVNSATRNLWVDAATDVLVMNNIFDGGTRGVQFGGGDRIVILGNKFANTTQQDLIDNIAAPAVDALIIGNHITGNVLGLTGAGTIVRDNHGFVTENNVLSPAFAIAAVAVVQVTIAHGLGVTPALEDCQLSVIEDTAVDDWEYGFVKVVSVGAANVICKVNVTNASATGGATAKLALHVDLTRG